MNYSVIIGQKLYQVSLCKYTILVSVARTSREQTKQLKTGVYYEHDYHCLNVPGSYFFT